MKKKKKKREYALMKNKPIPGRMSIYTYNLAVQLDGNWVYPTDLEMRVLLAIVEDIKRISTRTQIRKRVWKAVRIGSATIEKVVVFLREKLGPGVIRTVRGKGYMISPEIEVDVYRV